MTRWHGRSFGELFQKNNVKFFNFWCPGATFYDYVLKNRPQIRVFRPKIRVVRWHGEGFELFFESVNTLLITAIYYNAQYIIYYHNN